MRLLLIGASGQLGYDLSRSLGSHDLTCLTRKDIEITDFSRTRDLLEEIKARVVVNLAAYHRVDECEEDVDRAFQVNAFAVRNLAIACSRLKAKLVHLSTDYVFDGRKGAPYVESDAPNPLNVYGYSKAVGEYFVRSLLGEFFIIRTSGLYGIAGSSGKGGNFVETMLRLALEGRSIRVVTDQVLSPTYTRDLAERIATLMVTSRYGIYHITNSGECSWYEFARGIFDLSGLDPDLTPVSSSALGAKARRPAYSVLNNAALEQAGFPPCRDWRQALEDYLKARCHG